MRRSEGEKRNSMRDYCGPERRFGEGEDSSCLLIETVSERRGKMIRLTVPSHIEIRGEWFWWEKKGPLFYDR